MDPLLSVVNRKINEQGEFLYPRFKDTGSREVRTPTKLENGDTYEGEWSHKGFPHGHGTLYKADGGVLWCSFYKGIPEGLGRLIEANGSVYNGDFVKGKKHGYGKLVHGKVTYEGEFRENKKTGKAIEEIAGTSRFNGYFVLGKKEGPGKLENHWKRSSYEGNFHNNMMSGYGKCNYADGSSYTGGWLDDKMHGEGEFCWPD